MKVECIIPNRIIGKKERGFIMHRALNAVAILMLMAAFAFGQTLQPVILTDSPARAASGEPNLFVDHRGKIYLSWIEAVGERRHALRFSLWEKNRWTVPRTISEGENWFVNWADFPSLISASDGTMAAHWLAKSAPDTFAYDVKLSLSTDGGRTWSKPVTPHRDKTTSEHGFVSMVELSKGKLAAAWLDGRKFKSSHGSHGSSADEMTLRFTTISRDSRMTEDRVIDERVCECCQTSAAMTSEGMVVVYRDRSEKEIRDISIARFVRGKWTEPQTVHADGWEIEGCPVNGPSVAARGKSVAVAWFTAAKDTPRVRIAFSTDAGASFGAPAEVDDGSPMGRAEVLMLDDGSAFVVWMERAGKGAEIRARRVKADGSREPSIKITETSAARSSGFPQIARSGQDVFFAWTESSNPARVRTAMMKIRGVKR